MQDDGVVKQGSVTVTASMGSKKDSTANLPGSQADPKTERHFDLPPRRFQETNYSKVGATLGITQSLGNFEFARVDAYIEDFCVPEDKRKTWDDNVKTAANYVVEAVVDLEAYLKDKREGLRKELTEKKEVKKEKLGF